MSCVVGSMARINIEDWFWTDPRVLAFSAAVGEAKAYGYLLKAIKVAQQFWIQERLVPTAVWDMYKFPKEMETVDLIERRPDGIYVRGSEEQFSWLVQRSKAGKNSKNKPRKNKIKEPKENDNLALTERVREVNGTNTGRSPQSQSQSQSQKEEGEQPSQVTKIQIQVLQKTWVETVNAMGANKSSITPYEQTEIARAVQKYGAEYTDKILYGARFEEKHSDFDPAKHISIRRALFGTNKKGDPFHEKFANLADQQQQPQWEAASDAV